MILIIRYTCGDYIFCFALFMVIILGIYVYLFQWKSFYLVLMDVYLLLSCIFMVKDEVLI